MDVLPPPWENRRYQQNDDARSVSRADSVLDYYCEVPQAGDLKYKRNNQNSKQIRTTDLQMRRSDSHKRLSDSYLYDDFGSDSRYAASKLDDRSTALDPARTGSFSRRKQQQYGSLSQSTVMHGSASMSKIPIVKDQQRPSVSFGGNDDRHQRTTKGSTSARSVGNSAGVGRTGSTSTTNSIPRSSSMPLNQLSQQYKYGSLPSRRPSKSSGSRRAASVASSPPLPEVRDPKEQREEQTRRLQAINQAPSGTPPWIGKFQPDPRLPAEQQMIPTVARKLALEQWVAEGGVAETFDIMWKNNETVPSLETKRRSYISSDAPPVIQPELLSRETSLGTSNESAEALPAPPALSESHEGVVGQSPQQSPSPSHRPPNFSRRSLQGTPVPVSAGSQMSTEPVTLTVCAEPDQQQATNLRTLPTEPITHPEVQEEIRHDRMPGPIINTSHELPSPTLAATNTASSPAVARRPEPAHPATHDAHPVPVAETEKLKKSPKCCVLM